MERGAQIANNEFVYENSQAPNGGVNFEDQNDQEMGVVSYDD